MTLTTRLAGIYGITDDGLLPGGKLFTAVEAALNAGISLLQYRSKTACAEQRLEQAARLQALCKRHGIPLIINDDIDLCRHAGAAGVHLGDEDPQPQQARAALGQEAIVGVTCHASLDAALAAEAAGADYVAFGRFFPSTTKPEAPSAPVDLLYEAKQRLTIPVVAIGGINPENGAALVEAGADMLAVIQALFGDGDVTANAGALLKLFPGKYCE